MPDGEPLVPLAITEHAGQRELLRFAADTQEAAIRDGKARMAQLTVATNAWAFARDGVFKEGSRSTDAITVEFWAKGMKSPITLIQRYEPFSRRGRFRIIGPPLLSIQGKMLDSSKNNDAQLELHKGLLQHQKAAELWRAWQ